MLVRNWLLLSSVLVGIFALTGRPTAVPPPPTASFYGVGDIAGGGHFSIVRDATKVGGVIYAVGGGTARLACAPCPQTDTAFLWTFDGANATLLPLPELFAGPVTIASPLTAQDITPNADFIASQARFGNASFELQAVRVQTTAGGSPFTNLNLGTLFSPALAVPGQASAISSDGTILYGAGAGPVGGQTRAVRFDTIGGSSEVIPLLPTYTSNSVVTRGTSASGHVAVGTATAGAAAQAFKYVHGGSMVAIPRLGGGTTNRALAVSPNGNLVLVIGESSEYPSGEAYLYAGPGMQPLGSPNEKWRATGSACAFTGCGAVTINGGMTADGSVVALTFRGVNPNGTSDGSQYGYFRNTHGWFHLTSALAANGVDIVADGWGEKLQVLGISSDGTLVFGSAPHNGGTEGFVAEFAPGALANFNPLAAPPANTSIVGAWAFDDDISAPENAVIFTDDGVYFLIEGGFERGLYAFNGSSVAFTTLVDTNGSMGASDVNGTRFMASVNGDILTDENGSAGGRIVGGPGSVVGGWVTGNPTERQNSGALVLTASKYFYAQDSPEIGGRSAQVGTYTWNPVTSEFLITPEGGSTEGGNVLTLSADGLDMVLVTGDNDTLEWRRVIDPATIPVISGTPLSASGVVGQAFSHDVNATNTVTFSATGLPNGLSIHSGTGLISGTPTVGGQFAVSVFATNTAGVSDIETLTLTIAIPTPVGQNVVVEPVVPEGQGPVTMSFGEITEAGTTTVTVIDLAENEVPLPGNVQIGGIVYEVQTTAQYSGLITLCFSYAGIDFGAATPRLFHYENNEWVDITTSVDPGTQTICGATTTLSPFAVLVSNVVRTGFYPPVNPIAGFLNTVRRNQTVPLKFNVFVNGVEQTTTAGVVTTAQEIVCDTSAPVDEVEPAAITGGAGLRYDVAAGHFILNWKVPQTLGCYMVRVLTEQDGLALTARFQVR